MSRYITQSIACFVLFSIISTPAFCNNMDKSSDSASQNTSSATPTNKGDTSTTAGNNSGGGTAATPQDKDCDHAFSSSGSPREKLAMSRSQSPCK